MTQDNIGGDGAKGERDMRAPDKLWLARRVGSTEWHLPVKGETMSWGNAEFVSYTRTDSTYLGAAWMREHAAAACGVVAAEAKEYNIPQMSLGASACCKAIRAIPLPTDADLLAEVAEMPEGYVDGLTQRQKEIIARLTEMKATGWSALAFHDESVELKREFYGNVSGWVYLPSPLEALAPFTAARKTT